MTFSPRLEALEARVTPSAYHQVWTDNNITVSFAPDPTESESTLVGSQESDFSSIALADPVFQETILKAFQDWAAPTNINFSVVEDSGADFGSPGALQGDPNFGDIRIGAIPMGFEGTIESHTTDVVATSIGFDWRAGTWTGDILLNTDVTFGLGEGTDDIDLYTVMLHEIGHSLGLSDRAFEDTTGSVMYPYHVLQTDGLPSQDAEDIAELYGERKVDRFEGEDGNEIQENAYQFRKAARKTLKRKLEPHETEGEGPSSFHRYQVDADITTATDVDYYWVTAKPNNPDFTAKLTTAGVSLLDAKLSVYDASGTLLDSGTTDANGTALVTVEGAVADAQYFLRVESSDSGSEFDVGSYELQVLKANNGNAYRKLNGAYNNWLAEAGDGVDDPTKIRKESHSTAAQRSFHVEGQITDENDIDYHWVRAIGNPSSELLSMTVAIWTTDPTAEVPMLRIFSDNGFPEDVTLNDELTVSPEDDDIWSNVDGRYVVRLDEFIEPGEKYFIEVSSSSETPVNYVLAVQFTGAEPDDPEGGGEGGGEGGEGGGEGGEGGEGTTGEIEGGLVLDSEGFLVSDYTTDESGGESRPNNAPQEFRALVITAPQLVRLDLLLRLDDAAEGATTGVQVAISDSNGEFHDGDLGENETEGENIFEEEFDLTGTDGEELRFDRLIWLEPGTYKIRISGASGLDGVDEDENGFDDPSGFDVYFELDGATLNDAIGIDLEGIPEQQRQPREVDPQWVEEAELGDGTGTGLITDSDYLERDWLFMNPWGDFFRWY